MNRIDRLNAILIQLQTKRCVPAREIAQRFDIGLRTVYRDIRALEEGGVPIGAEPGRGYFLAKGYHLPPVMFSRSEAGAFVFGAKLIEKYCEESIAAQYAAALDKIKAVLGSADQEYINCLEDQVAVLNTARPSPPGSMDAILVQLQPALADSRMLRITYFSAYRQEITFRKVEPLGLCFYYANWHLLAYCHLRKDYRDFRVDRIQAVQAFGECFNRKRHADLQKLIKQMITTVDYQPARVVFTSQAAQAMGTQKYFYGFIHEYERDGSIEMDFLVPDLNQLAAWLLSFANQATVKSPEALVQIMADLVRRLGAHYQHS